jgi:hypothetical protein
MPRLTIRHLMLLVLYVAPGMPALGAPAPVRAFYLSPATFVGAPVALAGVSWFILRPGPNLDWVIVFLVWLGLTLFSGGSCIGIFMHAEDWFAFVLGALAYLLVLCLSTWIAERWLIPIQCPLCGKNSLLGADPWLGWQRSQELLGIKALPARQESEQFSFCHCEFCGLEELLSRAEARQGCPNCARGRPHRLWTPKDGSRTPDSFLRYEFYWCMACSGRCKRLLPGIWEEAVTPEDDEHYGRSDPMKWLRGRVDRIASMVRARYQARLGSCRTGGRTGPQ